MNVQWRKIGRLVLAAGGALSLCLTVATACAQSEQDDQNSPPATSRTYRTSPSNSPQGNSADGWRDRSNDDSDAAESRAAQQPVPNQADQQAESPRAGSPGYAPSYQHPQTNSGRPDPMRNVVDPRYRQPSNSPQNGQSGRYVDPRQQTRPMNQPANSSNSQYGSTSGPYYGYPPARARTVAYNRQDIEYADDQPHMAPGGPGQPMMSGEMLPPSSGQPMDAQGAWEGSQPGCGCANGNCAAGGCSDGSCGCDPCDGGCWARNVSRCFSEWCRADAFRDLSIYAGVQGFKDPIDLGENGDFGFHEGANWGMPLWGCSGVGIQLGFEFDHSDLAPNATVFGDHRNQYFMTGGVFYRPTRECGWQGGIVWDYLDDEFYDSVKVGQLRGNLSYVVDWSEVGFEFAVGVHSDKTSTIPFDTGIGTIYQPVDLYTLYYGRRLANGGEFKVYGGLADGLGGIVGSTLDIAISDSFSLQGDFSYIIADHVPAGQIPGESANLAFSIVWHPGCHARDTFDSAYRPLFNVADNSSFIVNRRTLP